MIFMIGAEKNKKEMKEVIVKINKTKSWFFEKISKTNKPLARLIKNKREDQRIQRILTGLVSKKPRNKRV